MLWVRAFVLVVFRGEDHVDVQRGTKQNGAGCTVHLPPGIVRTRGIFQATGYPHVETLAREAIA